MGNNNCCRGNQNTILKLNQYDLQDLSVKYGRNQRNGLESFKNSTVTYRASSSIFGEQNARLPTSISMEYHT